MSDLKEEYNALGERKKQIEKEMRDMGEKLLKEGASAFFDKYPKLQQFSWRQYSPFFNDGDACIFSADTSYWGIDLNGLGERAMEEEEEIEVGDDGDYISCYDTERDELIVKVTGFTEKEFDVIRKEIAAFLKPFPDNDLEALFGNHVEVVVNRNGIDVEEYTNHN